jgi:NAD(P)-dependent dehydrogenase (short-subunit alcohol dehydrogenase family)
MTMTDFITGSQTATSPAIAAGELAGTVAVVTGGGRGIGRVLAQALAAAGAAVGIIARSADQLAQTEQLIKATGGQVAAVPADVTDGPAVAHALGTLGRRLGPIDLLVNNAGTAGPAGNAWQVDPDAWWQTIEVNLRSVFNCARHVLPDMLARRQGRIINITSQAGVYRWPQVSGYSVSKAAVVKFTENLAVETRSHGVSVFSVHPGLTPIGLSESLADAPARSAEAKMHAWVSQQLADGHGADPSWAANLVLRLAAGHADALTGRHLSVHDNLDTLLTSIDDIRHRDLYQLRVRTLTPPK